MNAGDEAELRRLRWKCRRGMRELDQLLERYLERQWRQESEARRGIFLRLLEAEDDRLWHWCMGNEIPSDDELAELVRRIRALPAS